MERCRAVGITNVDVNTSNSVAPIRENLSGAPEARGRPSGGAGLRLAITKQVVALNAMGGGLEVRIALPMAG